jgi:hypothetical protein
MMCDTVVGMLPELEHLAADIADLSLACAAIEGTPDALLIAQVVHHLRSTMEHLMDRTEMLASPMPWWTEWQAQGLPR